MMGWAPCYGQEHRLCDVGGGAAAAPWALPTIWGCDAGAQRWGGPVHGSGQSRHCWAVGLGGTLYSPTPPPVHMAPTAT